jgi:hypothetical protein
MGTSGVFSTKISSVTIVVRTEAIAGGALAMVTLAEECLWFYCSTTPFTDQRKTPFGGQKNGHRL